MNLTNFGHSHFEKGYLDLDRLLFSFLLALEVCGRHLFPMLLSCLLFNITRQVEQKLTIVFSFQIETSLGRTTITERMVLLSLTPGTKFTVKGLVSQVPNDDAPVVNFGKKMLDWISEAQWQGVLVSVFKCCGVNSLGSHFAYTHWSSPVQSTCSFRTNIIHRS